MKQKSKIILMVGLILLAIGGYLYVQNNNGDIDQKNRDIALNSTNAYDAARQISENNRGEVGGHTLAMFLLGMGGALTVFSIYTITKKEQIAD